MISDTAKIYPNVIMGRNVVVEDFCVIGCPPHGGAGNMETIIGDNAVIRSHTVIYAGNLIGAHFQTGNKANIRESNVIGDNVSIGTLSVVEHHVRLFDFVRIHSQAFIPEYSILEKGCWLGPNVVLTNAKYPCSPKAKENLKGVIIGKEAVIGANATILPGVIIGHSSIVGASSVVTKDIKPFEVVAGNPATKINTREMLPYACK